MDILWDCWEIIAHGVQVGQGVELDALWDNGTCVQV